MTKCPFCEVTSQDVDGAPSAELLSHIQTHPEITIRAKAKLEAMQAEIEAESSKHRSFEEILQAVKDYCPPSVADDLLFMYTRIQELTKWLGSERARLLNSASRPASR
jgi:hypothetical protein